MYNVKLEKEEWMELARAVTFFGVPLDRLSRDDLIANIGYLLTQVEDMKRMHRVWLGENTFKP
jgi:hypothetical protein